MYSSRMIDWRSGLVENEGGDQGGGSGRKGRSPEEEEEEEFLQNRARSGRDF